MKTLILAAASAVALASGASAADFVATNTGDIVAYFNGSSAAFTEVLGLRINGVDTGVTGLNNKSSQIGDSLVLGTAQAGDVLTFFINVNDGSSTYTLYSDPLLNSDLQEHTLASAFAGGNGVPAGTAVGFEDTVGGGDRDYNDLQFVFTNVTAVPPTADVPEPATWGMMLLGFGIVGAAARRRRRIAAAA